MHHSPRKDLHIKLDAEQRLNAKLNQEIEQQLQESNELRKQLEDARSKIQEHQRRSCAQEPSAAPKQSPRGQTLGLSYDGLLDLLGRF